MASLVMYPGKEACKCMEYMASLVMYPGKEACECTEYMASLVRFVPLGQPGGGGLHTIGHTNRGSWLHPCLKAIKQAIRP